MKKYYGFLIGAVLSAIFCSIRVVQLYNEFFIIKQYTVTKVLIVWSLLVTFNAFGCMIIGAIADYIKNKRINYFNGLTHWARLNEKLLYYVPEVDKWMTYDEVSKLESSSKKGYILVSSSNDKIKNLKSAIRHIKKHDEIPKGTRMRLESRFKGFDIIITK